VTTQRKIRKIVKNKKSGQRKEEKALVASVIEILASRVLSESISFFLHLAHQWRVQECKKGVMVKVQFLYQAFSPSEVIPGIAFDTQNLFTHSGIGHRYHTNVM